MTMILTSTPGDILHVTKKEMESDHLIVVVLSKNVFINSDLSLSFLFLIVASVT
jgi:hypothetical protein